MTSSTDWTCSQFAISLDSGELLELLTRVRSEIAQIEGFRLLNLVAQDDGYEVTASVYYRVAEKPESQFE